MEEGKGGVGEMEGGWPVEGGEGGWVGWREGGQWREGRNSRVASFTLLTSCVLDIPDSDNMRNTTDRPNDRPTDRPSDRPSDRPTDRLLTDRPTA